MTSAIIQPTISRFEALVKQNELTATVAEQLKQVLSTCDIVLLCDDSTSMNAEIKEEKGVAFGPPKPKMTRWLELKKLAHTVIEFTTAINPNGIDLYFLNRPKLTNVTDMKDMQATFASPPNGGTPLSATLNKIYSDKVNLLNAGKQLLIVVVTDGEPSDLSNVESSRNLLYRTLYNMTYHGNVHVSFAECTDNEENTAYLDAWDGQITNFDNTDDYRDELKRVKQLQGQKFKFDYTDYVIKILLATFVRWYFNLDQKRITQPSTVSYSKPYQPDTGVEDCTCTIL